MRARAKRNAKQVIMNILLPIRAFALAVILAMTACETEHETVTTTTEETTRVHPVPAATTTETTTTHVR